MRARFRHCLWLLVAAASCLALLTSSAAHASPESTLIRGVPFVQQRPDFCGEACVAMALRHLGHAVEQDEVFDVAGVDPGLGRGLVTAELAQALRQLGVNPGTVWYPLAPGNGALAAQFHALHADLRAGIPSIVCMHYDEQPRTTEHFRLLLGYDASRDELIYHEPASARGAYQRMARGQFLKLWPLTHADGRRVAIRLRLPPSTIRRPLRAGLPGHRPADYAQHILALRARLSTVPGKFEIKVAQPFVVVGDLAPGTIHAYAKLLVRRTVDSLKREYFSQDPPQILDVWLFKDETSYHANALRLFGDRPSTPFGYYSSANRALVMNIDTGGGTLVHELVHPFVEANFPGAPPWLNEGLGSLYEAVDWPQGKITGLLNWRLPGLQQAIGQNALPTLERLLRMNANEFYGEGSGLHYAMARYLLYYLQVNGLLRRTYQQLFQQRATDSSGRRTLEHVLGRSDLRSFQREWESFVMRLAWKAR